MMLTQKDSSMSGFNRFASMFSPFCCEHFRMRSSVPSIISAMVGTSTRVSVQRTEMGFFRCSAGMDRTASKINAASPSATDAVLAAAKADQPGPLIFPIELLERSFDLLKHP